MKKVMIFTLLCIAGSTSINAGKLKIKNHADQPIIITKIEVHGPDTMKLDKHIQFPNITLKNGKSHIIESDVEQVWIQRGGKFFIVTAPSNGKRVSTIIVKDDEIKTPKKEFSVREYLAEEPVTSIEKAITYKAIQQKVSTIAPHKGAKVAQ